LASLTPESPFWYVTECLFSDWKTNTVSNYIGHFVVKEFQPKCEEQSETGVNMFAKEQLHRSWKCHVQSVTSLCLAVSSALSIWRHLQDFKTTILPTAMGFQQLPVIKYQNFYLGSPGVTSWHL
jgi:hypothetical protein